MRVWARKTSGLKASRRGQTTAEYAIIVALVAVASIAILVIFGDQIRNLFGVEAKQISGNSAAQQTPLTDTSSAEKRGLGNF